MNASVLARGLSEDVILARRLRRVVARAARRERGVGEAVAIARVAPKVNVTFVARDHGLAAQVFRLEVFDAQARPSRSVVRRLELRGLGQLGERRRASLV